MKLIAGLGNPGSEYEHTRHNMGFDVLDLLAQRFSVSLWKDSMKAQIATVSKAGEKILLVKPQTYMNGSGEAVGEIARYYKIDTSDIWIVCDDLDLPPGHIRIRKKGSAGGHNGLKSVISHLGTEEFLRFRIGVGHPKDGNTVIEHVLQRPYGDDIEVIETAKKMTAEAVETALSDGVDKAMNRWNTKRG